ncbi:MAG: organomercurial lyase [Candidatus Kariarchaeaceae archaeon]|jgi:hypothetical protein
MGAKFGQTLLQEQNEIRQFILTQTPLLGHLPSIAEIRAAFPQYSKENVDQILNQLDQFDVIHLSTDKMVIEAAYPFSASNTAHRVVLKKDGYKPVYAMCSIDALGIGFMLNCDTSIESICYHCGEGNNIGIRDKKIIFMEPELLVVWGDMEYSCCAATSLCKNINFFSSEQHFMEWQSNNLLRRGVLLHIHEAFYLGKKFFEKRL